MLIIDLFSTLEEEVIVENVANLISKWNLGQYYSLYSNNCQHFVNELMNNALGISNIQHQLDDKIFDIITNLKSSGKYQVDKLFKNHEHLSKFNNHQDLDFYILEKKFEDQLLLEFVNTDDENLSNKEKLIKKQIIQKLNKSNEILNDTPTKLECELNLHDSLEESEWNSIDILKINKIEEELNLLKSFDRVYWLKFVHYDVSLPDVKINQTSTNNFLNDLETYKEFEKLLNSLENMFVDNKNDSQIDSLNMIKKNLLDKYLSVEKLLNNIISSNDESFGIYEMKNVQSQNSKIISKFLDDLNQLDSKFKLLKEEIKNVKEAFKYLWILVFDSLKQMKKKFEVEIASRKINIKINQPLKGKEAIRRFLFKFTKESIAIKELNNIIYQKYDQFDEYPTKKEVNNFIEKHKEIFFTNLHQNTMILLLEKYDNNICPFNDPFTQTFSLPKIYEKKK